MARSRARSAIIFIAILLVVFTALIALLSALTDDGAGESSLSEVFLSKPQVAVAPITGTIDSADETLKLLRKYAKKSSVKAIVLRIDSPGGAVAPAQEIYRQIVKIRKKKPVVASMQTVAASAAYYIASATDTIVCSKGTITGSIGVIMILPNVNEATEKIGLKVNVIKAGKFKDIGSMVRPMTDDEREYLQTFAKQVHVQFIDDVASGRKGKISREELERIADGRFVTGETAMELGLVDSFGNFYDAVDKAAKLANIKDPKVLLPEKEWGYLDLLVQTAIDTASEAMCKAGLRSTAPLIR